jgi:hypothetical protein
LSATTRELLRLLQAVARLVERLDPPPPPRPEPKPEPALHLKFRAGSQEWFMSLPKPAPRPDDVDMATIGKKYDDQLRSRPIRSFKPWRNWG